MTIEVRDGIVVNVVPLDEGAAIPPSEFGRWPTVDDLFALIRTQLEPDRTDVEDARVRYHPDFGYPTSIELAGPRDVQDFGATHTASALTPLS